MKDETNAAKIMVDEMVLASKHKSEPMKAPATEPKAADVETKSEKNTVAAAAPGNANDDKNEFGKTSEDGDGEEAAAEDIDEEEAGEDEMNEEEGEDELEEMLNADDKGELREGTAEMKSRMNRIKSV